MTIEQYLSGKVDFNLNENVISSILFDRNVLSGSLVCTVSEKNRDLCLADLYMFCANSSTASSGEYDADGGWVRQRPNKNVFNRENYISMAKRLYEKWGDAAPSVVTGITLKDLY